MTTSTMTRPIRQAALTALAAAACVLAVAVLTAACGDPADDRAAEPTGQPSITGTVTSTAGVTNGDIVGSFLVEDGKGDYDTASVAVTVRTGWFRPGGDGDYIVISRPSAQELANKTVEVQFAGAVAESYPVQATAGWVVIAD